MDVLLMGLIAVCCWWLLRREAIKRRDWNDDCCNTFYAAVERAVTNACETGTCACDDIIKEIEDAFDEYCQREW